MSVDSIVIIPTFNEKENIERVLNKVFSLSKEFHVLIVDDNSPDGTGDIVTRLINKYPNKLHLLSREGKQGLGTAYIAGFRWALDRSYKYIFEMDADFSHNPNDLKRLYDACANNQADLAIGSRYITGLNVVNWPMSRVLLSYYASAYVRLMTRMKIRDTTAGFKCFKREVLEAIPLNKVQFTGYAFQIEMKFISWKKGFNLVEIPIIFTDRSHGESKMSKGIIKEAVFGVILMRWRNFIGNYNK